MSKKSKKTKLTGWTDKNFVDVPASVWKILSLFIKENKDVLSSEEVKKLMGDKIDGRQLGAWLGVLGKYKGREPLLFPILKKGHGNMVWQLNGAYRLKIKEFLNKIEKYL